MEGLHVSTSQASGIALPETILLSKLSYGLRLNDFTLGANEAMHVTIV